MIGIARNASLTAWLCSIRESVFEGSFEDLQHNEDPFVMQYLKDAAWR